MMTNYKTEGVPRLESFADMSRMNKEKTLSSLKNQREVDRVVDGMFVPEKIQSQMRKKGVGNKRHAHEHSLGGVMGHLEHHIHDNLNATKDLRTHTSYHN